MAVNDTPLTPSQAAKLVGTGAHNIRRWCEWHSGKLSAGANPKAGAPRRLTLVDVEVLKTVKTLREQGLQTADINERIAGMTFAVAEQPVDTDIVESSQAAQASQGDASALLPVVLEALRSVTSPLEARLEALERRIEPVEAQRLRVDVAFLVLMAFVVGVLVGLAVWWFQ